MENSYRIGDLTLSARERRSAGAPRAIVLTLHGGGYGAAYWDFPPTSLLTRAAARGCLGVAIDRPGYGMAFDRPMPLAVQAEIVLDLAAELRAREGDVPLFLTGHSMGGILALMIGAHADATDHVAAIDVSGVPLRYSDPMQEALLGQRLRGDATHFPAIDADHARALFFGPDGSFAPEALDHDALLRAPVPGAEMPDAANAPRDLPATMRRIALPVRLTFAAREMSSIATAEVAAAAHADLAGNPHSLVRYEADSGHNISLHHVGGAFHDSMLDWFDAVTETAA